MSSSCLSVGYVEAKNITDNLDRYVVLAFFLAAVLTIIIVILFVKYITYNIQRDREQKQIIAQRKCLPKRESEETEDSDEELIWYESSDEGDAIEKRKGQDGYETSTSSLYTCYIESTNELLEEQNDDLSEKIDGLDLSWLVSRLRLPENFIQPNENQLSNLLVDIFFSREKDTEITLPLLLCYEQLLHQVIILRKVAFLQLINFTIDLLLQQRVIYESTSLRLKSKYEQKFDIVNVEHRSHNMLTLSKRIMLIIHEFIKDLMTISVEKKILHELISLLFSQPLNCLKIFLLSTTDHSRAFNKITKMLVSSIADYEKTMMTMEGRFLFMKQSTKEVQTSASTIISSFNDEIKEIFAHYKDQFQNSLMNMNRRKFGDTTQLVLQLEQKLNTLKLDYINSAGNILKKLQGFSESMMGVFVSHLEAHSNFLISSKKQEVQKIKSSFNNIQKEAMLRMQNSEEKYLLSLQENCNFDDGKIATIVQDIQSMLKKLIKEHDTMVHSFDAFLNKNQEKIITFVNMCIDFTVKFVSSRYRTVLAANIAYIKSWPAIPTKMQAKRELSTHGKMSLASFDVVVGLMKRLIMNLENNDYSMQVSLPCRKNDCLLTCSAFSPTDFLTTSIFNELQLKTFQIPDDMLRYKEYFSIAIEVFSNISASLERSLALDVKNANEMVYEDHLVLHKAFRGKLSGPKKESVQRKNSKYMSRKRSSFKEKAVSAKLTDIYQGLLDVKEHRYNEQRNELDLDNGIQTETNKQKTKHQNLCSKYLSMQSSFLKSSLESELPSILYQTDSYYMREMLLKKINSCDGEKDRESESPPHKTKEKHNAPKSRSPDKIKIKSSKKSTLVPKTRKSRRVGDVS